MKQIRKPWDEFVEIWKVIQGILYKMEESKRLDLEERMQDYIFRSRSEGNELLEEAIMGRRVLTAYERKGLWREEKSKENWKKQSRPLARC